MPHAPAPIASVDTERFIRDGFVRIHDAVPTPLADACREILWAASGCTPTDPATWTKPVVRIGELASPPFREAASTKALTAALDLLVGNGQWLPRGSLGTFPIRFPSAEDPGDDGWHIDPSFGVEGVPDFMEWRVNLASRGRSLLMLFLFSDVGEDDAPTRLLAGSHRRIARLLGPRGDRGMSLRELVDARFGDAAEHCEEHRATGRSGTVYLCHPFLVHAAQPHRGTHPRFLAQPALLPSDPDRGATGTVGEAILRALAEP